jgi:hypothetical protein
MSVSARKISIPGLGKLVWLSLPVLLCSCPAWPQQPRMYQTAKSALADSQRRQASAGGQQHAEHQAGSISGKVVDQSGVNITGAVVRLTREGQSRGLEVTSDEDGLFSFSNVAPGPFHLTISSPDLASQDFSGTIKPGEAYVTPLFMLVIPTQVTEVHVEGLTPEELADVQILRRSALHIPALPVRTRSNDLRPAWPIPARTPTPRSVIGSLADFHASPNLCFVVRGLSEAR